MVSRIKSKLEFKMLCSLKKYGERLQLCEQIEKSSRPVFIYQMGKVGSKSIAHSLSTVYGEPVVHGHGFSDTFHSWKIRILYHFYKMGKPLDIISLTREPVSRNVSHFFQDYRGALSRPLDDLLKDFLANYDHDLATHWFDLHIKNNFDIDVYGKAMPPCGYQVYEKGRVRVLLIKIETEDGMIEHAVRQFLNLDQFSLISHNVGKDKAYGALYKQFVKEVCLPKEYIQLRLSDKYFKHFYDEKTAQAVWDKWYHSKHE